MTFLGGPGANSSCLKSTASPNVTSCHSGNFFPVFSSHSTSEMPGNHVGGGGTNPHSQTSSARLHYWGLRGVTQGWGNWSGGLRRALPVGQGGIGESSRGAVDTRPPAPRKITTLPQAPLPDPAKVPNLRQDSLEPPVPAFQLHQMAHRGWGYQGQWWDTLF